MILIDAVYINAGGGKNLLQELLLSLRGVVDVALLRDTRIEDLDTAGMKVFDIPASEAGRTRFYRSHRDLLRRVLCFGNVPPPLSLRAEVRVYFHNMTLCQAYPGESIFTKIQSILKLHYIRQLSNNADGFFVQSDLVKSALAAHLPKGTVITVWPFYSKKSHDFSNSTTDDSNWLRYAYVSNAYTHKNHRRLIKAWELLASQGLFPELHLTVYGNYSEVNALIKEAQIKGVKIVNHGFTDPAILYKLCAYQIYPSLIESFGLGLVEAAEAGCAIVAADLPYVHAAVKPEILFDPLSVVSISDAVVCTMGEHANASEIVIKNRLKDLVSWMQLGQSADLRG
jgi:glycosyltransferase involved in cell wall biosynthesis